MGLPWVISGGPAALALYLGSAVGLITLRRLLAARNLPAAPVAEKPFEYDR